LPQEGGKRRQPVVGVVDFNIDVVAGVIVVIISVGPASAHLLDAGSDLKAVHPVFQGLRGAQTSRHRSLEGPLSSGSDVTQVQASIRRRRGQGFVSRPRPFRLVFVASVCLEFNLEGLSEVRTSDASGQRVSRSKFWTEGEGRRTRRRRRISRSSSAAGSGRADEAALLDADADLAAEEDGGQAEAYRCVRVLVVVIPRHHTDADDGQASEERYQARRGHSDAGVETERSGFGQRCDLARLVPEERGAVSGQGQERGAGRQGLGQAQQPRRPERALS